MTHDVQLILAPMRSVTTVNYRKAFVRHFGGVDVEMAPFNCDPEATKRFLAPFN